MSEFTPARGSNSELLARKVKSSENLNLLFWGSLLADVPGAVVATSAFAPTLIGSLATAEYFNNQLIGIIGSGAAVGEVAIGCCALPLISLALYTKRRAARKEARVLANGLDYADNPNPLPHMEVKKTQDSFIANTKSTVLWGLRLAAMAGVATGTGVAGSFVGGPAAGFVAGLISAGITGKFLVSRISTYREAGYQLKRMKQAERRSR